ncbi:hypothetical protein HYFRA_00000978 [Hymenoscyphus fraxineus]|uniref:Uncharacterized protein n=1 Tax=Hymenoscyphus fraxineus TaxID=746836 RepID=A0A9N9PR89_9HELO|nr:hypothetical protein HYFRA_00000978 [Hymenoscyphus fraxineus]
MGTLMQVIWLRQIKDLFQNWRGKISGFMTDGDSINASDTENEAKFNMRFSNLLVPLEIALLAGVEQVMAGPGGYVSLVNASPYDWVLLYKHEYQMDWQPKDVIPAGKTLEYTSDFAHITN